MILSNLRKEIMFNFSNIKIQTALGLSAAAALIYEVVCTDMLLFYFIDSSYSISTILSVFLLGLGIGSLTVYFLLDKINNKKLIFAILQVLIAIYAFFILTNLKSIIPPLETYGTFFTSFAVLLVPTIFLGAVFPLSAAIFKKKNKDITGLIYASDLFGAITGSLFAGFVLIPFFGGRTAIIFGATLNLISSLIIFSKKNKLIPIILIFIFVILSINIQGIINNQTTLNYKESNNYQFYANSPYGTVKVVNDTLFIADREQCSLCYPETTSERMMVEYALENLTELIELRVLNIGLGCGLTLEKCLEYTYNIQVDVVEINEQVVNANKVITDVLEDYRVNLIIDDGLHYLRNTEKKYDSILIDIEEPNVAHASNLYTVEAFEIINKSLTETGTFALWNYRGNEKDKYTDILYYSLKEEFAHVYQYPGVFLATKQQIDKEEYEPTTPYEINIIDKNTLTDAYLGKS